MAKNNSIKKLPAIARASADRIEGLHIPITQQETLGLSKDSKEKPYLALKYYNHSHQCFSEWTQEELREFSHFNRKLSEMTWEMLKQQGGKKKPKTGLGCTILDSSAVDHLPKTPELKKVSPDVTWMEMRVTEKARIMGFRMSAVFFMVWLDRGHVALD